MKPSLVYYISSMDEEIFNIIEKSLDSGLAEEELLAAVPLKRNLELKYEKAPFNYRKFCIYAAIIAILYAIKNPLSYQRPLSHLLDLKDEYLVGHKDPCMVNHNAISMEVLRPISKCSICDKITKVSCYGIICL